MASTPERTLTPTSIVPSLTVDDLQRSISFFQALGFDIEERWEDQGELRGVMLHAGGSRIGLSQDDWKKGRDRTKGVGMRLFLGIGTAQNVDELAARARTAGLTLDREPHDTPWGSRAFELTEPSGFLVTVSTE